MGAIQSTLVMYLEDAEPKLRASPAIIDGPSGTFRGFTYEQLEKYTSCLAHGLRQHGVKEGSVVGLLAPNLPEWALIFHATGSLGAIFMPCNLMLSSSELHQQLQHSKAKVIITVPSLFEKVKSAATNTLTSTTNNTSNPTPDKNAATPHLFVIGAAEGAKSFGSLLQTGIIDWEFEASDEGRGSMSIMSEDMPSIYMYTTTTTTTTTGNSQKILDRQSISHGELLEVLLPSYGGEDDDSNSNDNDNKNILGLEDGIDVVAGCLPFWRLDGLIGVMLQSCFKLCMVVTFDNLDGRTVGKVITDIGITVLPTTNNMMQKIVRESRRNSRTESGSVSKEGGEDTPSLSSLCNIVCVTGDSNCSYKEKTEKENEKTSQDTIKLFQKTFHLTTEADKGNSTCNYSITKSLTSLEYDTSPILWPDVHSSVDYVMPAFFRQQHANEQDNGLLVTTDVTLVCSNGVILDSEKVIQIFDNYGDGQVSSSVRPNGMTLEVSGPWPLLFRGLASCHALAHSVGSTTAVHTTMSMSTTTADGVSIRQPDIGKQRRHSRKSRSGSFSNFSSIGSPSQLSSNTTVPISPEMRSMHTQLLQEEDILKRERERHEMLSKQLMRTKNAAHDMILRNRELEEKISSAENGYDVERKRQVLSQRKRSNSSPKSISSPRNSISHDQNSNGGETKNSNGNSKLSNASTESFNIDQMNSQVSPVQEEDEESSDTDADTDDEPDGRPSKIEEDEIALQEELEEDMRRLLQRGVMLFSENQAIQAKPLFEEVVRIAHDLGNVAVEGRAVGNLASVFEATGQHHRAIELYMQCISILRKIGDSRKEARILYNVSHSYLSLERFDEAIDYLNQSLALTDDPQTRQAVEQQLAVVRHAMIQQSEMEDDDRLMDF